MLGERIASQPEVIRAIVSGYGLCCGVPHQTPVTAVGIRCRPGARAQLRHGRSRIMKPKVAGSREGMAGSRIMKPKVAGSRACAHRVAAVGLACSCAANDDRQPLRSCPAVGDICPGRAKGRKSGTHREGSKSSTDLYVA